jgi:NTE family protein
MNVDNDFQIPRVNPEALMPVEIIETGSEFDKGLPQQGVGLCLSGGGFRAMLFHAGALLRLNEAGLLSQLDRISTVSGGSIIAGVLAQNWSRLAFDDKGVAGEFDTQLIKPIRDFADKSIDVSSVLRGLLLPGSPADRVVAAYKRYLYGEASLQDLPDSPRFIFNAFNVQSGALWRFSKPYMADWRVGLIRSPRLLLAQAVAASTAFPPFFSPLRLRLKEDEYQPGSGGGLQHAPFTTDVHLSDGGVYDNLGLETVWKRYDTVLVSDGGGQTQPEANPSTYWPQHTYRIFSLVDKQVRSLRKRQVIDSYKRYTEGITRGVDLQDPLFRMTARRGTYWGIRSDIENYHLPTALNCPEEKTTRLAEISTRMARLEPDVQERLINWGYAICDAALRKHYDPTLPIPADFPYPATGVG